MTWAINEGGAPIRPEVYEFLVNVGRAINVTPFRTATARPPTGPYAPDLLPLMQQMAWTTNQYPLTTEVQTFLKTISWFFTSTGANMNPGPYTKPTFPPIPTALESLPLTSIQFLLQVAYWLINEGDSPQYQEARDFLVAVGIHLRHPNPRTAPGPYRYPA